MMVIPRKNLGGVYADHDLGLHIFFTCPGLCSFTRYPMGGRPSERVVAVKFNVKQKRVIEVSPEHLAEDVPGVVWGDRKGTLLYLEPRKPLREGNGGLNHVHEDQHVRQHPQGFLNTTHYILLGGSMYQLSHLDTYMRVETPTSTRRVATSP
ncbi:hypothetical protein E2C01_038558 [Portunus trituberculatus]|uniref:Uncharacterized protein n=1 Tax=Portunus trituberculatus TaxID=210409 RepID=A0A5B7FHI1_PORTR|nr:hypothetical protein [Portunus trituberculatus]